MKILFLGMIFSTLAFAKTHRVDCYNVIEGTDVGGKFETKVAFDSGAPSFVETTTVTITGHSPSVTKTTTTYLSPKIVCGLNLDFAKDCTLTETLDPKYGYDFYFKCGKEITRGEIYCDENCLTAAGSGATLRCEGPNVDKKLAGGGLVFQGCKVSEVAGAR